MREEIKQSGLNTVELSRKIGVTPEMITQYCTTDKMPRIETLEKLQRALDISSDYLLGITDVP
ncbi:MAG: helix-turn-helix domain-containing protein [Corallococcus sp.]|nr:helix-turn-helix domain-containing protein [Corallococcus sp.]